MSAGLPVEVLYRLYASQCGRCCYCNRHCIWENRHISLGVLKYNAATIEHVYSKFDIRRFTNDGKRELLMACHSCNQKRSNREVDAMKFKIDTSFSIINLLTQNT